jgi:hypothetical protein
MASHKTATLLLVAVAALGLAALTYPMTYRSELLWSGRQVAGAGTSAPAPRPRARSCLFAPAELGNANVLSSCACCAEEQR